MDLQLYLQSTLYFGINLVIIFLLYLLISFIKLNQKKKQFEAVHQEIKKGQKVILTSGLYGEIKKFDNEVVYVEIAKDVIVKASRFSVQGIED